MYPDFSIEQGLGSVTIGVDEAGRGPLAGPVIAAAIILDGSAAGIGINDSKKLSAHQREHIYKILVRNYEYKVAFVEAEQIDEINILNATMLAMKEAIKGFSLTGRHIIVDGNKAPFKADNIHTVVKGDTKSLSIGAASIIAKVERDRHMHQLAAEFPHYKWDANAGYGTKDHIAAIRKHGICKHHRLSFLKKICLT